jgi:hypothetical protein
MTARFSAIARPYGDVSTFSTFGINGFVSTSSTMSRVVYQGDSSQAVSPFQQSGALFSFDAKEL